MSDRVFIPGWHPEYAAAARVTSEGSPLRVMASFGDDRPLPPSFSLSKWRKWPFDQGQVGSCFANGPTQLAQIDFTIGDPDGAFPMSRRLTWYQGRKLDGSLGGRGDGGSVTNAVIALTDGKGGVGGCHEDLWPYKASHSYLEQTPPASVFADASKYRLTAFADLELGDATKRSIFNGNGAAIGIWWPYGWDTEGATFFKTIGRGTFGHALLVIGWATFGTELYWQIENSHGPIYAPLPADHAASVPNYVPAFADKTHDFWVLDSTLRTVMGYGNAELVTAAGPTGFAKRDLTLAEGIAL